MAMKDFSRWLIACGLPLMAACWVFAAEQPAGQVTYYVSNAGDDGWSGKLAEPETAASSRRKVEPFDLRQVRLLNGPFREAMERDRRYLLSLDGERQLRAFRLAAGLSSSAKPLGGWENPTVWRSRCR